MIKECTRKTETVEGFETLSFKDIKSVSLQDRKESKYIMNSAKLENLLSRLKDYYYLVQNKKEKSQRYDTTYFDTEDFELYNTHHNGKLNRYKVRSRTYLNSNKNYAEVKFKNNKKITCKKRNCLDGNNIGAEEFFNREAPIPFNKLEKKLLVSYERMTFVDKKLTHRITIDLNLSFQNQETEYAIGDMCILEIKKERSQKKTTVEKALKSEQVYPYRISKYCLGIIALYPQVKQNLFKKKIHYIEKLLGHSLFKKIQYLKLA